MRARAGRRPGVIITSLTGLEIGTVVDHAKAAPSASITTSSLSGVIELVFGGVQGDNDSGARAHVTAALVAALGCLREWISALEEQIATQLERHPDATVFTSLPKAGVVRAARPLVEIGDARGRYPTLELLINAASAAPSTGQSGKVNIVSFRWAVDRELRGAVVDFAGEADHTGFWAADVYQRARARGHDHPHATRMLARAWLTVIWPCWQDGVL